MDFCHLLSCDCPITEKGLARRQDPTWNKFYSVLNSQPGGQGAVEVWFFRGGDDLVVESQIPQGTDELAGSEDKIEKRDRENDGRDDKFDTGGAEFSNMDDVEFERSEQEQSSDD